MADFSLSQIGETSGSPVQPQQGIASGAASQALSFAGNLGSALFGDYNQRQEKKAEAEQESMANRAVTRFVNQQMQIADLVDQGKLSSQEARMRMRYNLTRAGADNPDLSEAFADAHSKVVGTAGMGKVAAEGTEQEQAFFATQREATKQGWVTPNMSQEEAARATMAFQSFNLEQQMIDAEQNAISLERAQVGLVTDRIQQDTARITQSTASINLSLKREEVKARQHLSSMADHYSVGLDARFKALERQVQSGEISPEDAVRAMDEEWLAVQSTVTEVGRSADTAYLNNVVSPMERLYNVRRGYLTGETTREVMDEQVELALSQQTAMLVADPEDASTIALSRLLGQGGALALTQPLTGIAIKHVQRNSDESRKPANVLDPSEEESTRGYLGILSNGVRRANDGNLDGGVEAEREITVNINQLLKGIGVYGASAESPTEFRATVDFLASDDYGRYAESHGTAISKENAAQARAILREQYDEVARPLIQREWRDAQELTYQLFDPTRPETAGAMEDTVDLIQPTFDGNGVRFVPSDDARLDNRIRRRLDKLNKEVAPVINQLVRMGAHLEGHRNYGKIYQDNYAPLFGGPEAGGNGE